jgi:hypothetical protein
MEVGRRLSFDYHYFHHRLFAARACEMLIGLIRSPTLREPMSPNLALQLPPLLVPHVGVGPGQPRSFLKN